MHHSAVPMTRRRLLTAAAGASLAAAGGAWRTTAAAGWWDDAGLDWPSAAHDLAATRAAPIPVRQGRVRWTARMEGGVPGAAAITGRTVVAASLGGEVAAFDLLTGRERWRVAPPLEPFFAGPAVAGDRVVVASDRALALDLRTGRTLWTAPSLRRDGGDDYFWGPPVVVGDLVLIGSGSGGEGAGGVVARGRLSAFDLRTGALRWTTPTVGPGANGGGVLGAPTVAGDLVYVTTGAPYSGGATPGTSSLVALRLRDGAVVRVAPSGQPHDLNSSALLLGRGVFATGKDGVHAWDRRTAAKRWHTAITPPAAQPGPTDGPEFGPLATDGRRLYALSNEDAAGTVTAAALDPRTGAILWRTALPGFAFAPPAIAGDRLWIATAAGTLHALALRDGATAAAIDLGAPSAGTVTSAGGVVLVGTGAAPHLPGDALTAIA